MQTHKHRDPPSEAEIERAFVSFCESHDCKALKLRIDGANGFPDRTILMPEGRTMYAEFKTLRGKLRPAQKRMINELRAMGFRVVEPRRIGDAERALVEELGIELFPKGEQV